MIAKTVALLTLLSVTMFIGNAYADQPFVNITDDSIEGNVGSLDGTGIVTIVISNPDGTTSTMNVNHTDSGYFKTPISFTQNGNFIITVSYGGVTIDTIPHSNTVEIKTPLYETDQDGVVSVQVFTIPFDVTITENGSVTVHNYDDIKHYVSHTGTTGNEIGGTFYKVIPSMSERTIEFPITGDSIYPIGVYSFEDTVTGNKGTITIEKWGGSNQAIQDTTITGVTQGIVEEVGVQENVVVVNHGDNTQTVVTTDTPVETPTNTVVVNEVDTYTITSLHNELIQANNELTKALESVGLLQNELNSSIGTITVQQQKIVSLETTVQETSSLSKEQVSNLKTENLVLEKQIVTLEADKVTLTKERDEWKTLSDNWYAVAKEQLRVMVNVLGL